MNKMDLRAKGFGLIEVVIGVAVVAVFLTAAINVFAVSRRLETELIKKIEAQYLAEEGVEVARLWRDNSWNANIAPLTLGASYYLHFDGSTWRATATPTMINGIFERKIIFSAGYRNADKDIVESGTVDNDLRKTTVTVAWAARRGTTTVSLITYFTNLFGN